MQYKPKRNLHTKLEIFLNRFIYMHCVGLMEFMNLKVHIGDRNLFPLFLNSYVFRTMKNVFETKELLVSRLVFTVVCR